MNNKPRYSLFKNARYALEGLAHAIKTESSFKLEIFFSVPILIAINLLDISFVSTLTLLVTLVLIMIVELLNSAIENVVDLVTKEVHPLAKSAKDVASTAVLFAVLLHIACWIIVLHKDMGLF